MVSANASARMATNAGPYDLMTHSFLAEQVFERDLQSVRRKPARIASCTSRKRSNAVFLRRASDIAITNAPSTFPQQVCQSLPSERYGIDFRKAGAI